MVYEFKIFKDRKKILENMLYGNYDLRRTVLLEKSPKGVVRSNGINSIKLISGRYSAVDISVRTSTPGILVYSDLYAEGWKVYIDGEEKELLRSDYALRSVYIPAGYHKVRFKYSPISFRIGLYLTIIGILVSIVFFTIGIVTLKSEQKRSLT